MGTPFKYSRYITAEWDGAFWQTTFTTPAWGAFPFSSVGALYESVVVTKLKGIVQDSATAASVVGAITRAGDATGHRYKIVPPEPGKDPNRAFTAWDDQYGVSPKDSHPYGWYPDESRPGKTHLVRANWTARGGGSNSTTHYNPYMDEAERVIVHEMVHALRQMLGWVDEVPLAGALADFVEEEEFFPMLVQNIYLSEMGHNDDLRGSHKEVKVLPADLRTSAGFIGDHAFGRAARALVKKFTEQCPDLCDLLARVVPTTGATGAPVFNPIREYLTPGSGATTP
jgi:hypothetical protein